MEKVLIIATVWVIVNTIAYLLFGIFGAVISTYVCMIILWKFRNKIK